MDGFSCHPDELVSGTYGVKEPPREALLVRPEVIDVILVPGLAFDVCGYRLGYGKGFYDTYLPRLSKNTLIIGLSHDETMLKSIPRDEHDVRVDLVVTPTAIYDGSTTEVPA